MLPSGWRLHRNQDIVSIIRRGQRVHTPAVSIYWRVRSGDSEQTRVACVVGKRTHQSAVKRHMYQRWLREAARRTIPTLPHPVDMVWVARPPILQLSSLQHLQEQIRPAVKKIIIKMSHEHTQPGA